VTDQPAAAENPVVPFLRAGPAPDRTRWEGWQQWRTTRGSFIPAPRLSLAEYGALSARSRALHDLHRTATHVNLRLQETPMSRKVSDLMRGRLQNNAVKFTPGTRDGLMISGGGFQGKTETACWAAAEFEDLWRGIHRQLAPGPAPGIRDLFVPVAYCRLPVRATPKALCKTILDVYGDPHPATLHDLVRSVRDAVRDHATTALLIDDITRLRLHRGDDQDTLDLIRELMDLNVTLVLIGVDIPGSGLLRGVRAGPPGASGPSPAAATATRPPLRPAGGSTWPTWTRSTTLRPPGSPRSWSTWPASRTSSGSCGPPRACSPPATCPSTCSAAPTASSGCSAASSRTAAPRRSPPARNGSPPSCWPAPPSGWATSMTSTPVPARSRTSPRTPPRRSSRRMAVAL
jgi:hypothetical protein